MHTLLSNVHFVLYRALFAHPTLQHFFYSQAHILCCIEHCFHILLYSAHFYSRAYILRCIEHFMYILLSSVHFVLYRELLHILLSSIHFLLSGTHFVLYRAFFAHPTLKRTFCAVLAPFAHPISSVHFVLNKAHPAL